MLLKEDLSKHHESLLAVLKAANTDTTIQYENGSVCTVTIDNLDSQAKTQLLEKIESVGIESFFIPSAIRRATQASMLHGSFYYKNYEVTNYSLIAKNSQLLFKDNSSISFSMNITHLSTAFPTNDQEEQAFVEAGGEIIAGTCTII